MLPHEPLVASLTQQFEVALSACLSQRYAQAGLIGEGIRYVMQAGGKRVRPVLCLLSASALAEDKLQEGARLAAMPAALAVEFVHAYSLVHDDLPCLDNDDVRRGRATAHKVFGDANALLIGDALLTDAFALLAEEAGEGAGVLSSAAKRLPMVRELASAAGGLGMVLGQCLDVFWTGRGGTSAEELHRIHRLKTGKLLGAAMALGALAAGASFDQVAALRQGGERIGLAFQILDDLLDERAGTGKSQGKDKQSGKLTYLSLMDAAAAHAVARAETDAALSLWRTAGVGADSALASYVVSLLKRQS